MFYCNSYDGRQFLDKNKLISDTKVTQLKIAKKTHPWLPKGYLHESYVKYENLIKLSNMGQSRKLWTKNFQS